MASSHNTSHTVLDTPQANEKKNIIARLSSGNAGLQIVTHYARWIIISGAILAVALGIVATKKFQLSIDFSGGSEFTISSAQHPDNKTIKRVFHDSIGIEPVVIQHVGSGKGASTVIKTEALTSQQHNVVQKALQGELAQFAHEHSVEQPQISYSDVSGSWGKQVTHKAGVGFIVFLFVVSIYIVIRYEWEMSLAAVSSLIFDVGTTAGVYSLTGLEVSPSTIIGLLTILGFSLYDTVVVFDKVRENTRNFLKQSQYTYRERVNLALNQTIMRSINTTVISVIPILSLLIVAVQLLGVGTLQDLGTVQLIGVLIGAYSSIFLATPLLVFIKERQSRTAMHTNKVLTRRQD